MTDNDTLFEAWPSISRLNRSITVTEKIDGSNAAILVRKTPPAAAADLIGSPMTAWLPGRFDDGDGAAVYCQSRKRTIQPGPTDLQGFAGWVKENAEGLLDFLDARGGSVGRHFGEWWGQGIQRKYGLDHKRFSLFNTARYEGPDVEFDPVPGSDRTVWVGTVPVMYEGPFSEDVIKGCLEHLATRGSHAAPGFPKPEGIVVYHQAAGTMFKVTVENDEKPKSQVGK